MPRVKLAGHRQFQSGNDDEVGDDELPVGFRYAGVDETADVFGRRTDIGERPSLQAHAVDDEGVGRRASGPSYDYLVTAIQPRAAPVPPPLEECTNHTRADPTRLT